MNNHDFLSALLDATTTDAASSAITRYEEEQELAVWSPVGGRENNRGPIEVSADPGRSLIERLTNGTDALLELEHLRHRGVPDCRSPREAASAWFELPDGGLAEMTPRQRQALARRLFIKISAGDGRDSRLVEVRDFGVGIAPEEASRTILSLNESNKIQKHYLAGTYGQGGSSTFAISKWTLIASRSTDRGDIGFTVVKFLDLPPEEFKTGHYVYLTLNGSVLVTEGDDESFPAGTLVKHFGYDLSDYPSPVGPNSVYGLLNLMLFDPPLPVWLDSELHGYRRVIKGSRNALNGAVDEGDESRQGPTLSHHMPMFYVSLGDFGRVGFEYWVLGQPTSENKRPSAAFVNPSRPIVFTLNGQNHAELSNAVVKKEAELPYLGQRFIGHIDCNSLTPAGKRALFASTREEARRGAVYQMIHDELVSALNSDDELTRLNQEAREQRLRDRDETAIADMRRQVAELLRLHGLDIGQMEGFSEGGGATAGGRPTRPHGPRRPTPPLEVNEPPTYIRIVWPEDGSIPFYAGQRRYIRVETDANSNYHNHQDPEHSRINIVVQGDSLVVRGSTPLRGGRMRVIIECLQGAAMDSQGELRIELSRPGQMTLADQRSTQVVAPPPARPTRQRVALPPFEVRPVEGPQDEQWAVLGWPDDITTVASSAETENGMLVVYYSTVFPRFQQQVARYERRDATLAASFVRRYEVWIATHSLLLHRDQESEDRDEVDEDNEVEETRERQERCRIGTLSALVASREIETGSIAADSAATETD